MPTPAPQATTPEQALAWEAGHRSRAALGSILAGVLALLGSIGGGLAAALKGEAHREAALITFLVTLSGVQIGGIGSALWGVLAGALTLFVQQWRPRASSRTS